MKLFADHCFFASGIALLRKSGYDIIKASEVGLQRAPDEDIVSFCKKEDRVILTLDTDFGNLYRFPLGTHKGIALFRITPFVPAVLLDILKILIDRKMFGSFKNALAVIRKEGVKIIRPGGSAETA